ncbi:MAG: hypothetical protein AB1540_07605 [Bdellovibrionota bacterium]
MNGIVRWTLGLWFGTLFLGILLSALPWTQAAHAQSRPGDVEPQSLGAGSRSQTRPGTPTTAAKDDKLFPAGKTGYFGGALGISSASEEVGTGLGFGGELAFFPQQYFGLGALYRGGNHGEPSSDLFAAQLLLRPTPPFTLSFILGAQKLSDAGINADTTFAYGAKAGYDFQLGNSIFSVGPNIDLVFYKPGAETVSNVNVLALLKTWL